MPGYYTLATGQIDFSDLPADAAKKTAVPAIARRRVGVACSHSSRQGTGLGGLLLAQTLRDCWEAGRTFAFVAVILDCVNDAAKAFYGHYFRQLPGYPLQAVCQRTTT